ncbi:MAG: carbonic anhydrase [Rubrimonas sp.]|uniref:carbonic anhydrase n=1 Tax=Rubrimonas sp. TaxID=2036015 RepID=UPI002FDD90D4
MPRKADALPPYLVERYRAWRALRFEQDKAWYARLAEGGQRPRAMIVSCCDSRIDAVGLFGAEPGDLFVLRNVAALIPPFTPDHSHHGSSAAVEYAITALRVAHVVVVGHSDCGGVAACCDICEGRAPHLEADTSFVGRWMEILRPGHARVAAANPERADRQRALEFEAVLTSLRNLETFPFVREAVDKGLVTLHGAWMDIGAGRLHVFDAPSRSFAQLG